MTFAVSTDLEGPEIQPCVITVTGDIDVMNAGQLRELLVEHYTAGARHFVLDLREVSFLDSTGLGVLVAAHRRTRNGAGSLRLVVTSSALLQLLRITGLSQVFRVYTTPEDALAAVYTQTPKAVLPAAVSAQLVALTPRTPRDDEQPISA